MSEASAPEWQIEMADYLGKLPVSIEGATLGQVAPLWAVDERTAIMLVQGWAMWIWPEVAAGITEGGGEASAALAVECLNGLMVWWGGGHSRAGGGGDCGLGGPPTGLAGASDSEEELPGRPLKRRRVGDGARDWPGGGLTGWDWVRALGAEWAGWANRVQPVALPGAGVPEVAWLCGMDPAVLTGDLQTLTDVLGDGQQPDQLLAELAESAAGDGRGLLPGGQQAAEAVVPGEASGKQAAAEAEWDWHAVLAAEGLLAPSASEAVADGRQAEAELSWWLGAAVSRDDLDTITDKALVRFHRDIDSAESSRQMRAVHDVLGGTAEKLGAVRAELRERQARGLVLIDNSYPRTSVPLIPADEGTPSVRALALLGTDLTEREAFWLGAAVSGDSLLVARAKYRQVFGEAISEGATQDEFRRFGAEADVIDTSVGNVRAILRRWAGQGFFTVPDAYRGVVLPAPGGPPEDLAERIANLSEEDKWLLGGALSDDAIRVITQKYQSRFPNRRRPSQQTIGRWVAKVAQTLGMSATAAGEAREILDRWRQRRGFDVPGDYAATVLPTNDRPPADLARKVADLSEEDKWLLGAALSDDAIRLITQKYQIRFQGNCRPSEPTIAARVVELARTLGMPAARPGEAREILGRWRHQRGFDVPGDYAATVLPTNGRPPADPACKVADLSEEDKWLLGGALSDDASLLITQKYQIRFPDRRRPRQWTIDDGMVELARRLGMPVTTAAEAREILDQWRQRRGFDVPGDYAATVLPTNDRPPADLARKVADLSEEDKWLLGAALSDDASLLITQKYQIRFPDRRRSGQRTIDDRMVELARRLGMPVTTAGEAREILDQWRQRRGFDVPGDYAATVLPTNDRPPGDLARKVADLSEEDKWLLGAALSDDAIRLITQKYQIRFPGNCRPSEPTIAAWMVELARTLGLLAATAGKAREILFRWWQQRGFDVPGDYAATVLPIGD